VRNTLTNEVQESFFRIAIRMSTIDQTGEQYGTVAITSLRYKNIGWFHGIRSYSTDVVEASTDNLDSARERPKGEHKMSGENTKQSEGHIEHGSACGCGCNSKDRTSAGAEEKAASEQAARDEVVRARNKSVRAPRNAPGAGSTPPFSDHSGSL
jgi:hypothetical protein